ncbi:MAG: hypothetical protein V4490_07100 [Pseudomonadota bacterium]
MRLLTLNEQNHVTGGEGEVPRAPYTGNFSTMNLTTTINPNNNFATTGIAIETHLNAHVTLGGQGVIDSFGNKTFSASVTICH